MLITFGIVKRLEIESIRIQASQVDEGSETKWK